MYNTINISHSGDLTANASEDGRSSECNRFFVTYIGYKVFIEIYIYRDILKKSF